MQTLTAMQFTKRNCPLINHFPTIVMHPYRVRRTDGEIVLFAHNLQKPLTRAEQLYIARTFPDVTRMETAGRYYEWLPKDTK